MLEGAGQPRSLRTRVYVDGYNFYYGCLKGTHFKWLDLYKLFQEHVLPSALIERDGQPVDSVLLPEALQYFTAKIIERAAKAHDSVSSQARYHTALRKLYDGRLRLVEGYYSLTKARAPRIDETVPDRWPRDCERVPIWRLEEKQTDVNLALHAYHDALTGQVDHVVIASNDTDLVPALRMIREHTSVTVGLVIPTRDSERWPNTDLAEHAHWVRRHLTDAELAAAQLPRVVPGGKTPTVKPDSWYPYPELFLEALRLATAVRGSRSKAFQWLEAPSEYLAAGGRSNCWRRKKARRASSPTCATGSTGSNWPQAREQRPRSRGPRVIQASALPVGHGGATAAVPNGDSPVRIVADAIISPSTGAGVRCALPAGTLEQLKL